MTKLEETIGFLEMLKGLNKTVIEIDSIMHRLTEMQEEAINYTHSCAELSEKEPTLVYNGKDRFGKEIWLNKNKT